MKYIVYTVLGLEQIAKDEITKKVPNACVNNVIRKRIILEGAISLREAKSLRTVDDIGILLLEDNLNIPEDIIQKVKVLDLLSIHKEISSIRNVNNTFSITIAGVGWRGFNYENLALSIAKEIQETYGWEYTPHDHSNFDTRIFIDKNAFLVSVRLADKSLHERDYKKFSKEGSLKSTIAASMVQLTANGRKGFKVTDTFCGSGTILCEAYLEGHNVYGSDIDKESVSITSKNLALLNYNYTDRLKVQDAIKTNWPNKCFDCAISNLPWEKQVKVESITNLYEGAVKEYRRILKESGVVCVLLTKPELFIKYAKKYFPNSSIDTYPISYIGQTPTIIIIKNS